MRVIAPPPAAVPVSEPVSPANPAADLVLLEGGPFLMGSQDADIWIDDGEGPVREVSLRPFYFSAQAVSNAQFAAFAEATGYVTDAEKFGWSYVFHLHVPEALRQKLQRGSQVRGLDWWVGLEGAAWKRPFGPGSDTARLLDHPAVHISWNDAAAYAAWAGLRLPTEAEWEYAARGGLVQNRFPWGNELEPGGKHLCNIWQGEFPRRDSGADGYRGTCPVKAFPPNGYGLYNMSGNVWEWCHDWFHPHYAFLGHHDNPRGPAIGERKVTKGGSFLCHESYCNRYRVSARTGNTPDTSTGNTGFRCAKDA
jgi:formylglycine-generating enzyme required for sulfatase activity